MPDSLRDSLPAIYRRILPELFDRPTPPERRATCDDCAMCGGDAAVEFLPSTKCCTFQPQLPNYLVGALLADESAELATGRARVRARISERPGSAGTPRTPGRVTPRWVAPSRKWQVLYKAAREEAFGRSALLLCSYYDEGRCSIWRHRESYCSTFFCKHEQGEDGRQLWRTVRVFLIEVEASLAAWAVQQIAPDLVGPERVMTLEELEDLPPREADYAAWWGDWLGREEAFYLRAAELVGTLGPGDLPRILTDHGKRRLPIIESRYDALATPRHPEVLVLASDLRLDELGDGRVRATAYSQYDPLVISAATAAALQRFTTAQPTSEALACFGEELLLELTRWRVLVAREKSEDI